MTTTEAAAILGIQPHSVMIYIRRGRIAATKQGGKYSITTAAIEEFQRTRRIQERPTDPVAEFWARVDKSGGPDACWPWTGAQFTDGYGQHRFYLPGVEERQSALAHRFAWEQVHGPIPPGYFVCHRCDNRPCCHAECEIIGCKHLKDSPGCQSHLFLGTAADNNADRDNKGRRGKPRDPSTRAQRISAAVHRYYQANPRKK